MADNSQKTPAKKLPHGRANSIATGILLLGFAFLVHIDSWWPGIMLVLAVYFAVLFTLIKKPMRMVFSVLITLAIYFAVMLSDKFPDLQISPMVIIFVILAIVMMTTGFFGADHDHHHRKSKWRDAFLDEIKKELSKKEHSEKEHSDTDND